MSVTQRWTFGPAWSRRRSNGLPPRRTRVGAAVVFASVVASLVGACSSAPVPRRDAVRGVSPSLYLWEISGGRGPAALIGSIHVGTRDLYPLAPPMEAAIARAAVITFETDPTAKTPRRRSRRLAEGESLRGRLTAGARARFEARVREIGAPLDTVDRFTPWFATITLWQLEAERAGVLASLGIEAHVLRRARGRKVVRGLEPADGHRLTAHAARRPTEQLAQLNAMVDQGRHLGAALRVSIDAWRLADDGFELRRRAGQSRRTAARRAGRNRRMATAIDAALRAEGRPQLFVVGVAHTVGGGSIVARLRARGFRLARARVTPPWYGPAHARRPRTDPKTGPGPLEALRQIGTNRTRGRPHHTDE